MNTHFVASKTAVQDLEKLAYEGQDPLKRGYHTGYEEYMDRLPILSDDDPMLKSKVRETKNVFDELATAIKRDGWFNKVIPQPGSFARSIVAMEQPQVIPGQTEVKEGIELIVGHWDKGFYAPVHGHGAGFLHEELLSGKLLINTYRLSDPEKGMVRPVRTEILQGGVNMVSTYTLPGKHFKREAYIHSFKALEYSTSLHYVPEHTRDGRDNRFEVEHFENTFHLDQENITRISSLDGLYLKVGDVCLVRSTNCDFKDFGDTYIVVTGHPIVQPRGLRPQVEIIPAPYTKDLLDKYDMPMGLILLKLNEKAKQAFLDFHDIKVENKHVTMPDALQSYL